MRYFEPDLSALSASDKRKISGLRRFLLQWYPEFGRQLPWRSPTATKFEQVCVEVLLQRTRAETVAAAYGSFFQRFRGWYDIAEATEDELQGYLRPLGLWRRRAASIKGLAAYASDHDGNFPSDPRTLSDVRGVGQYVMNAILLFQHGKKRPLIDVNMARVLERYVRPRKLADIRYDPWLQAASLWLVQNRPIETNWATLDFAASICTAHLPRCELCPIRRQCEWAKHHR
jgi:A/G-specific adenine glycosylase